jgi:hypothetical protein
VGLPFYKTAYIVLIILKFGFVLGSYSTKSYIFLELSCNSGLHMRLEKALEQVEHKFERGLKKRFACSHCGKTWVEIVGLFTVNTEGQEDTCLQIGKESEACQNCKFNIRSCPACGSKDAYEINFPSKTTQDSPLSFDRIRIVSKT